MSTLITFAQNLVAELKQRGYAGARYSFGIGHRPQAGGNLLKVSLGGSDEPVLVLAESHSTAVLHSSDPAAGGAERLGKVRLPRRTASNWAKAVEYLLDQASL